MTFADLNPSWESWRFSDARLLVDRVAEAPPTGLQLLFESTPAPPPSSQRLEKAAQTRSSLSNASRPASLEMFLPRSSRMMSNGGMEC